jgi:DNA-binding LytR/AlgR family response regulator
MQVLICDDDRNYAVQFGKQILAIAVRNKVDVTCDIVSSGKELLFFIGTKYRKVDLIYLDYHMEDLNGMETAIALRNKGVTADIVFNSNDSSYAIDAYDVDALGYIVKGKTSEAKCEEIFMKAVKRCRKRNDETITFSHCNEQRNIPIENILYFEVKNRTVTVHYLRNKKVETFDFISSLSKIEEKLAPKGFERSHSAFLVAKRHIYKRTQTQIEMVNGDVLPIGKSHQKKTQKN